MYFPDDITFQYFFFDTYIGYFLQIVPIAVLAGSLHGVCLYRKERNAPLSRIISSSLFVSYMTGLVGLVLLLDIVKDLWYWLLYRANSFSFERSFTFTFNLMPNFWHHLSSEAIGNIILFLPFGILYPLSNSSVSFKNVFWDGFICIAAIELLQPIFGRAFDINDILLNTTGVALSAALFFGIKRMVYKE